MEKLTVIEGGKSKAPGTTHDRAIPEGYTTADKICKSGLLIVFDGTMFERLPGVGHMSAADLPPHVVLALVKVACDAAHTN